MRIYGIVVAAFANSFDHGFWDNVSKRRPTQKQALAVTPEKIALMHSELSEALEEYRAGKPVLYYKRTEQGMKPEGLLAEYADVIIRIGDHVGSLGLAKELEQAIGEKMAYNAKRPYRHGNKKA